MPCIMMSGVTRHLSLSVPGSSMKAALGVESGAIVVVTQKGGGPIGFVADQPAGNAGAVTASNRSMKTVLLASAHGVTLAVAVAVAVGVGEGSCSKTKIWLLVPVIVGLTVSVAVI